MGRRTKKRALTRNSPLSYPLFMGGTLRCYKCDVTRDPKDPICPKCEHSRVYISIYYKGKHHKFSRHNQTGLTMTIDLADRMLTNIRSKIDEGSFNPEDWKQSKIRERKFENKIYLWLDLKKTEMEANEFSPETYKAYSGFIKNHYLPFFAGQDVREIDYEQLENFKDAISKKNIKIKTRKNILNALRAFFNWLKRKGVIKETPLFPTIKGDDATVRKAISYQSQIEALKKIPRIHRDIIEFCFETGLRNGEVVVLKVGDIDFIGANALIQRSVSGSKIVETTKAKNKRWIPLSNRAYDIAKKQQRNKLPESWLFINPETKRRYNAKKLTQLWNTYSGTNVSFYEASRHSFCTQLIENGIDVSMVKELARHADIRTTEKYLHIRTSRTREAVNNRSKVIPITGNINKQR